MKSGIFTILAVIGICLIWSSSGGFPPGNPHCDVCEALSNGFAEVADAFTCPACPDCPSGGLTVMAEFITPSQADTLDLTCPDTFQLLDCRCGVESDCTRFQVTPTTCTVGIDGDLVLIITCIQTDETLSVIETSGTNSFQQFCTTGSVVNCFVGQSQLDTVKIYPVLDVENNKCTVTCTNICNLYTLCKE